MKKFVVLYHAASKNEEQMKGTSPEQMNEIMTAWGTWAEKCGEGLVEMGAPLSGGMSVTPGGSVASTKEVTGYSVLQAESMEAAMKMMEGHPHFLTPNECSIEVHEMMPVPGM